MKVSEIVENLDAKVFIGQDLLDLEVQSACGRLYEAGLKRGGIREIS